jgi:YidC/Oxa1 family membrane protein insertase
MAPAGIDKSAVVDGSPSFETVEQLLDAEPKAIADAAVDPTMAAVTYWGQLKDMGLDYGWGPTAFFENLIELSYLNTGLGWAGCIGLSTIAIRTALFYFQVQGSNAGAQLAALKPALQPIMDEMEAAKRRGDDERANALKLKQQAVMGEMGGSLYKSFLTPVMQGVFGYGAFRCLRGMTNLPVAGMETEGYAWFSDLTIADPLYILPAATGAIMFGIMKVC